DTEGIALDLRFDYVRRRHACHLDAHLKAEFHVGDLGLEHGLVMRRIDGGQVPHSFHAGGEEESVFEPIEYFRARGRYRDLATDIRRSLPRCCGFLRRGALGPPKRGFGFDALDTCILLGSARPSRSRGGKLPGQRMLALRLLVSPYSPHLHPYFPSAFL